jgi:disease resistance protein RPM1
VAQKGGRAANLLRDRAEEIAIDLLKEVNRKPAMDLALGAMGSLLLQLGELLKEEYKMQTSVKQDIEAFSRELQSMRAALRRVAEVLREELDEEVKLWAGDVRELSYDTEDVVDSLIVRVKGSEADTELNIFRELMGKMGRLFKQGKARREICNGNQGHQGAAQGCGHQT